MEIFGKNILNLDDIVHVIRLGDDTYELILCCGPSVVVQLTDAEFADLAVELGVPVPEEDDA